MQPRSSEAGIAPDTIADALPSAAVRVAPPIVALSEDAMLLEAVSTAALDQATVIVCPTADRFADQLIATGAELALVDAGAVAELASLLDSLHRQFPQLQLLVAGPGNVQHQIIPQLSDGTVFRFAHKPTSAARLKLFIDAALRARRERITAEILNAPVPSTHIEAAREPAQPLRWLTAAVLGVLAGVAGNYWYQDRGSTSTLAGGAVSETAARTAVSPSREVRAAEAAEEQAAIDQASAERSQRSEQERLAAEISARQTTQVAQAEQAPRSAGVTPEQRLQPDSETLMDGADLQREAASLIENMPVILFEAPETGEGPGAGAAAATHPVAATSAVMDESLLHRLDFVSPQYPLDALRHGTTGDVELDFTVTPTGDVTDVKVTSSSPAGVFDATSIEALSHSRYEPVERDGVAVAQRAHIRMRYEL